MSFTVIIPAFNASRTIIKCLDSISLQTKKPEKLIIINDGSTDDTLEIILSHEVNQVIDTTILSIQNSGVAAARNLGIKTCNTNYYFLLDADDYFEPTHIEEISRISILHKDAVLIFSGINRVFLNEDVFNNEKNLPDFSKIALSCSDLQKNDIYLLNDNAPNILLSGNFIPISSSCIKLTEDKLLFKEGVPNGEDMLFMIEILHRGNGIFVNKRTCNVMRHHCNASSKNNSLRIHNSIIPLMIQLKRSPNYRKIDKTKIQRELDKHISSSVYYSSHQGIKAFFINTIFLCNSNFNLIYKWQLYKGLIISILKSLKIL